MASKTPASLPRKATRLSTAVALALALFKLTVGLYTGAVSVLASAVDSFLDFLVSSFNAVAVRTSEKPRDQAFNYGRGKIEGLAAALQGLFILGSAAFIVRESILKLPSPKAISLEGLNLAMAVMALSLAVTLGLLVYLSKASRKSDSLVLEADTLHYRTDLFSNGAILAGMVAIRFTGWQAVDPILALAVSAYIVPASFPLIRKGLDMLLDRALPDSLTERITSIASGHSPLVNGVHELRTRRSGDVNFVEFHLVFDEGIALGEAHRVADEIEMRVRELDPGKWSVSIHLDPVDDSKRDQKLHGSRLAGN
jgi:cation diffusion facilitator family transporter